MLALYAGGALWVWGQNLFGQLGDGTTTNRLSPVQIGEDHNWVLILKPSFDHDGDGKADIAVWRPADGNWYILGSKNGFMATNWGLRDDVPIQ